MSTPDGRAPEAEDPPRGAVPLRPAPKPPGGCGLTGCLYGTVLLFALLLAILLGYALVRGWQVPPNVRQGAAGSR